MLAQETFGKHMAGRCIQKNNFKTSEIKYLEIIPTLPMWIIEYVWAHRMMDILDALEPAMWPEEDLQSLNLDEPWRLRMVAAQAYAIIKTRDFRRFERVMEFLDVTYKLLPHLVPPVKHMKIMFGLKTMVIIWMLREDQGIVNTVLKTITFFPTRLPQYRGCSQREMYEMRKHHRDFKALAQTLATELSVRNAYIKDLMDHQYGEHYAQKLEERLMHYLQALESAVKTDTYFDQLLKQGAPMAYEEEFIWPLISCDSNSLAASLKSLLHCAHSSSRCTRSHGDNKVRIGSAQKSGMRRKWEGPAEGSPKERTLIGQSQVHSKSPGYSQVTCQHTPPVRSSSLVLESLVLDQACADNQGSRPKLFVAKPKMGPSEDSPLRLDEGCRGWTGDTVEVWEQSEEVHEVSPLQLCSKHQKWVRSILLGCSEELQCEQGVHFFLIPGFDPILNTLCPSQHLTTDTQNTPPPHPLAVSQPGSRVEQAGRTCRDQLRMSVTSQAFLLQSKFLQPVVRLRKLTDQECGIAAELRGTCTAPSVEYHGDDEDDDEEEDEEHVDDFLTFGVCAFSEIVKVQL
ncbi:hypothetical protein DPEC_G00215480 [Dallia pectoralis]|uniref:Uncharacterized protein n=1 Tax=Dallia pectoralis TaxID=75939 RepID=A0ACC2G2E7_DALPE|nr:hypothetical protein DPEC_G00215480 [Dallia pectoralis]